MSSTAPGVDAIKALHREFIENLFETDLGIPIEEITTLPRCNNNFIHFVTFKYPVSSPAPISSKQGTSPLLVGTTKAIFRVGNPAATFNHAVKVENTVAMMHLMRQALPSIIPHLYAWSKAGGPSDNGWILEQYMPGTNIEAEFHSHMSRESQRHVLRQIAEVLKTVQDFKIPATASGFGGPAFGEDKVVSGPFVVEPYNGPYSDMKTFYQNMLRAQLEEADRSRVVKGWRGNGLRDRLDAFVEKGLDGILSKALTKDVEPSLIIGDVAISNFLFDPTTYQILGLVDYDCSHTGHPLHEFFFSSFSVSYFVLSDNQAVVSALLHGFPSPLPASVPPTGPECRDNDEPQWEVMLMFEEELARAGAARPSSIEGAKEIAEVYGFMAEVFPFHFGMERWVQKQSEEKLKESVGRQEKTIEKALAKWGF